MENGKEKKSGLGGDAVEKRRKAVMWCICLTRLSAMPLSLSLVFSNHRYPKSLLLRLIAASVSRRCLSKYPIMACPTS